MNLCLHLIHGPWRHLTPCTVLQGMLLIILYGVLRYNMLWTRVCNELPARNAFVNIQIFYGSHLLEIMSQDAIVLILFNFESYIYVPTMWVKKKEETCQFIFYEPIVIVLTHVLSNQSFSVSSNVMFIIIQ